MEKENREPSQPPCTYILPLGDVLFLLTIVIAKKIHASLGNPVALNSEGFLTDIDIQSLDEDSLTWEDKWHDINHYFSAPVVMMVNGKTKKYCSCKICLYMSDSVFFSISPYVTIALTVTKRASSMKLQYYATI